MSLHRKWGDIFKKEVYVQRVCPLDDVPPRHDRDGNDRDGNDRDGNDRDGNDREIVRHEERIADGDVLVRAEEVEPTEVLKMILRYSDNYKR